MKDNLLLQKPIILCRRGFENFRSIHLWYIVVISVLVALFILLPGGDELGGFYKTITKEGSWKMALRLVGLVLLIPLFFLYIKTISNSYIELTQEKITYHSGLPKCIQIIRPDWSCRWDQINEVSLGKYSLGNPLLTPLIIKTLEETNSILPWQWVDPNNPEDLAASKKIFGANKQKLQAILQNTTLFKIMGDKELLDEQAILRAPEEYDINNNPVALIIAGLFIITVIYFIIDVYIGLSEFYVTTPPWHWNLFAGLICGCVVFNVLKRTKIKRQEIIIMSLMFSIGISLSAYPLILRLNKLTDKVGMIQYTYVLTDNNQWIQIDNITPPLIFDSGTGYWTQFKVGDKKQFELRKGGLGFYQVNMESIYQEQRKFYKEQ